MPIWVVLTVKPTFSSSTPMSLIFESRTKRFPYFVYITSVTNNWKIIEKKNFSLGIEPDYSFQTLDRNENKLETVR